MVLHFPFSQTTDNELSTSVEPAVSGDGVKWYPTGDRNKALIDGKNGIQLSKTYSKSMFMFDLTKPSWPLNGVPNRGENRLSIIQNLIEKTIIDYGLT